MGKALVIGLTALAVAFGAAALAWRSAAPPTQPDSGAVQVVDAPSSQSIFPKVLNR